MSKITVALAAAFLATTSSLCLAQTPSGAAAAPKEFTEAVSKALIDRRIEIIKVTLGLTPEQQKLWPAVEDAIRARLTQRHMRFANVAARVETKGEFNAIEAMRNRADRLTQRGASLKKLADAWQPLYASLDSNQKQRLGFLAVYVAREMRDGLQARILDAIDEDADDDED